MLGRPKVGLLHVSALVIAAGLLLLVVGRARLEAPSLFIIIAGSGALLYWLLSHRTYIKLDVDFLYSLLHMYVVSTGSQPPGEIVRSASKGPYGRYSKTYRKAAELSKRWGYTVPEALSLSSRGERNKAFKEFMERFAVISAVGEEVTSFLKVEYETIKFNYQNLYNRSLDSLNVLYGAYASTMVSVIFAITTMMLLFFFFGGTSLRIVILSYVAALIAIAVLGVLVILKAPKNLFEAKRSRNPTALLADVLAIAGFVLGVIISYMILSRGVNYVTVGISFIVFGLFFVPAGYVINNMENLIDDYDKFFPVMIRSLGIYLSQVPDLRQAVKELSKIELGRLRKLLENLQASLAMGVDKDIAMAKFAVQTGSENIYRSLQVFADVMDHGGDLSETGVALSDHMNLLLMLRERKLQVTGNFLSTLILMHASVIAIMVFMAEMMYYFSQLLIPLRASISASFANIFVFGNINVPLLESSTLIFAAVITLINAYILAVTKVGSSRSFYLFLAILSIMTGGAIVGVAALMSYLFHIFPVTAAGLP
ncbi:type II secretion system F family protein [Acidilobus sp.]|jgi:flagellar protein FlaJ|uniref:type II secretion system F family protein n=1 Tax=Acidilobus sp. TaxID=1872109 RepID=UPI003D00702E